MEETTNPKEPSSKRPKLIAPWLRLLAIIVVALAAGYVGGNLAQLNTSSTQMEEPRQAIDNEGQLIAEIAEQVGPSVVSVELEQQGVFSAQQSLGSGIIVSEDGLIVTNKHVVEEGISTKVVTADGTEYDDVKLIDVDPFNDIAYLKISDVSGLKAAKLGDSTEVVVGERVIAIGNALGEYPNTVTYGIISGLSRPVLAGDGRGQSFESLDNLFQTDAAINPGNSGGPLVNMDGEIIGINTAVAGNAENIGFSIPIEDVKPGIKSVIDNGELIRPYLGVRYISLNKAVAERYDLTVEQGAYVVEDDLVDAVLDNSPAEKAGIKPGDVIISVAGQKVTANRALSTIMAQQEVGAEIDVEIVRDDKEQTLTVKLEAYRD